MPSIRSIANAMAKRSTIFGGNGIDANADWHEGPHARDLG